jgi:hypothetical protein
LIVSISQLNRRQELRSPFTPRAAITIHEKSNGARVFNSNETGHNKAEGLILTGGK